MNEDRRLAARPATALVALARAVALDEAVAAVDLERIVEAVTDAPTERAALLSAIIEANNAEIRVTVAHLVASHAAMLHEREAGLTDIDEVAGAWGLRLTAGGLLLAGGAIAAGTLSGGAAALALLAATGGAVAVGVGRLRLRMARNAAARRREMAERLAADVMAARRE